MMLLVTVEVVPGGNILSRRILGVMKIANDRSGTDFEGNYVAEISGPEAYNACRVKGFRRLENGPWELVLAALEKAPKTRKGRVAV